VRFPPWGLALAALARHKNRRHAHRPSRSAPTRRLKKSTKKAAQRTYTPNGQKVSGKWVFDNRKNRFLEVFVGKSMDLTKGMVKSCLTSFFKTYVGAFF
jgi:hypothetical protein